MKVLLRRPLTAITLAVCLSYQVSALAHSEAGSVTASANHDVMTLPLSIDWSRSIEQIKASKTTQPSDELPNRLTYKSELFGTEFHQEYLFTEQGKLKNVLLYHSVDADSLTCVEQYKQIKADVVSQFGESKLNELSINPLESIDRAKICELTSIGEYKLFSEWLQTDDKVSLVLDTWKGQAYIGLSYYPISAL